MNYKLLKGDALEKLKLLPDNSIDSCVTDPPAGISFMGNSWDEDKGGRDEWIKWLSDIFIEVNRVLKPGGHCLVWALPRTSHWTATAIEDAGFEIRDVINHIFGSGYPKSLNIGKGVDKKLGNEREVIGKLENYQNKSSGGGGNSHMMQEVKPRIDIDLTKGSSIYEGWGTGLKPACEHWILCRKPISEKTIVDNVLRWGTGGINVDGCRIGTEDIIKSIPTERKEDSGNSWNKGMIRTEDWEQNNLGRFPANLIHDGSEEVMEEFEKAGISKGNKPGAIRRGKSIFCNYETEEIGRTGYNDLGTPARFFYCSKPSTKERNMGCDELEEKEELFTDKGNINHNRFCKDCGLTYNGSNNHSECSGELIDGENKKPRKNNHPTIKSVKLMSYLITLITPDNGIVLDPFTGSGTTGISSLLLNKKFIGIEQNEEYIKIAETRIKAYEKYRIFLK